VCRSNFSRNNVDSERGMGMRFWTVCCLGAIFNFVLAYHIAKSDPCGCSVTCSFFRGVAYGNNNGNPISCTYYDPWTAFDQNYWCTNATCSGGILVGLNPATYQFQTCDDNTCQMYCIPCTNGLQTSDTKSPNVMTGCVNFGMPQQRFGCDPNQVGARSRKGERSQRIVTLSEP